MFIYDCCSGEKERDNASRRRLTIDASTDEESSNDESAEGDVVVTKSAEEETKSEKMELKQNEEIINDVQSTEQGKNVGMIDMGRATTVQWARDEKNPDYQLAVINAANEGFQSKLDTQRGSYVITEFTEKLRENMNDKNNKRFLFEIFEKIQSDLHDKGKQLPENTFNNGTRYIKFYKNYGDKAGFNANMSYIREENRMLSASETARASEVEDKELTDKRTKLQQINTSTVSDIEETEMTNMRTNTYME